MILNPLEGDKCWCSHCNELRMTWYPVCEKHYEDTPAGLRSDFEKQLSLDSCLRFAPGESYWTLFNLIILYHEYQELWNRKREIP